MLTRYFIFTFSAIITTIYALYKCHETAVGFTSCSTPKNLRSAQTPPQIPLFFFFFFSHMWIKAGRKNRCGLGTSESGLALIMV